MVAIMKLTNLDIIKTEDFLSGVFQFKVEAPPFNTAFEEAGYDTSNFIIELGPIFIIGCSAIVFFVFRIIILRLSKANSDFCLRRLVLQFYPQSIVLRYLIESCIEMGLVALISIKSMD